LGAANLRAALNHPAARSLNLNSVIDEIVDEVKELSKPNLGLLHPETDSPDAKWIFPFLE